MQREAREKVSNMNLPEEILETRFEVCSNLQLEELYKSVQLVIHDKGRFRRS